MADEPKVSPFDNPVGRAFAKVVEDPEFADAVRANPQETLARFGLSESEFEIVVADAAALDAEVQGFAFPRPGQQSFANLMGGLRTPSLLGVNATTHGWTGCLTCT